MKTDDYKEAPPVPFIYVPTIGDLIQQSAGPVYLMLLTKSENRADFGWTRYLITVTGFSNPEDDDGDRHPIEWRAEIGMSMSVDESGVRKLSKDADKVKTRIVKRLTEAGRDVRSGILSFEPVLGVLPEAEPEVM